MMITSDNFNTKILFILYINLRNVHAKPETTSDNLKKHPMKNCSYLVIQQHQLDVINVI